MIYKFTAYGHPNILATHKTTLEFTKDSEVSLRGNCIVGVKADFELNEIKEFIRNSKKKVTITIKTITNKQKIQEKISAEVNPDFNSDKEFVIRKSGFVSERTFAISSNKAAFELDKELISFLRKKDNKIVVVIEYE